jgi:hypothetical protein
VHWDRHIHFLQNKSQTENNSNFPISSDDGDNDGHFSNDTIGKDINIVSPSDDNEEEETTPPNLFQFSFDPCNSDEDLEDEGECFNVPFTKRLLPPAELATNGQVNKSPVNSREGSNTRETVHETNAPPPP